MQSKQTQKVHLKELSKSPGWSIMEYRVNEQLKVLRSQLENDPNVDTKANQNQIKAYNLILRWVEESKGREPDAE